MNDATASTEPRVCSSAEQIAKQDRLASLDVFRGITILSMILVDKPGSWDDLYWPLAHAHWQGWTPTDLVFPFFVFIVGSSLAFSLRKFVAGTDVSPAIYGRIIRRTLLLLALGLVLNHFHLLCEYVFGNSQSLELANWRFPGVLQRIAIVYLLTALIALHLTVRVQLLLAVTISLGYWALLVWLPDPTNYLKNLSPEGNLVRLIDQAVIGTHHLYTQGTVEKTDPEGLLSTLPAVVTALSGYWAGLFIQKHGVSVRTAAWLVAGGISSVACGLMWNDLFPISKKLWTSSFVMLTSGVAIIVLAGCLLLFDVWTWRRVAKPFRIVGENAIFVYVASWLAEVLLDDVHWEGTSLKEHVYEGLFTNWIHSPQLASLGFAVATVVFWWFVLWLMSSRGWKIAV